MIEYKAKGAHTVVVRSNNKLLLVRTSDKDSAQNERYNNLNKITKAQIKEGFKINPQRFNKLFEQIKKADSKEKD